MKDTATNIKTIESVLYNDFFKSHQYELNAFIRSLEKNYPFISLIDTFAHGGLSTLLQNAFLNHLISSFEKVNYMEVGVYHGATIASALSGNEKVLNKVTINDNWNWGNAQYDIFERNIIKILSLYYEEKYSLICVKEKRPLTHEEKIDSENERIIKLDNTFDMTIVRGNTWDSADTIMNQWGDDKVDIYFYDGDHEYQSQHDALVYFKDCLADEFIFIVDDFVEGNDVAKGTYAGIEKSGYKILFSDNTHNWSADPKSQYSWGGGWFIAYLKKE